MCVCVCVCVCVGVGVWVCWWTCITHAVSNELHGVSQQVYYTPCVERGWGSFTVISAQALLRILGGLRHAPATINGSRARAVCHIRSYEWRLTCIVWPWNQLGEMKYGVVLLLMVSVLPFTACRTLPLNGEKRQATANGDESASDVHLADPSRRNAGCFVYEREAWVVTK